MIFYKESPAIPQAADFPVSTGRQLLHSLHAPIRFCCTAVGFCFRVCHAAVKF